MLVNMPKPDAALRDFFKDNEVFAALFNGYLFDNKEVIHPDRLEPDDTAYITTLKVTGNPKKTKYEKINRYRDIIRKSSFGYLVILGVEDQDKIHYSMPVRKLLYDALGYSSELVGKGKTQDKIEWTVDERLSKVQKGTKITPIITVVFYTGEKPWDGPRCLYDMMELDEEIKPYVPNYPLYVIDIGHDVDLSFNNKELDDLKTALGAVYLRQGDVTQVAVSKSSLALAGILANDVNLYNVAVGTKEGEKIVCKALEERDAKIREEVAKEYGEKFAEQNARMVELTAEILELKRQLAMAGL